MHGGVSSVHGSGNPMHGGFIGYLGFGTSDRVGQEVSGRAITTLISFWGLGTLPPSETGPVVCVGLDALGMVICQVPMDKKCSMF